MDYTVGGTQLNLLFAKTLSPSRLTRKRSSSPNPVETTATLGLPRSLVVKNPPVNAGDARDPGSIPGSEDSLEEGMATAPVLLPGESHGQRSLVGYSPSGRRVGLY